MIDTFKLMCGCVCTIEDDGDYIINVIGGKIHCKEYSTHIKPHFRELVVRESTETTYDLAIKQYKVTSHNYDNTARDYRCICNHKITEVFYVYNEFTRKYVGPIGSTCIEEFDDPDIIHQVIVLKRKAKDSAPRCDTCGHKLRATHYGILKNQCKSCWKEYYKDHDEQLALVHKQLKKTIRQRLLRKGMQGFRTALDRKRMRQAFRNSHKLKVQKLNREFRQVTLHPLLRKGIQGFQTALDRRRFRQALRNSHKSQVRTLNSELKRMTYLSTRMSQKISFGKYKFDKTYAYICHKDPSYASWLIQKCECLNPQIKSDLIKCTTKPKIWKIVTALKTEVPTCS